MNVEIHKMIFLSTYEIYFFLNYFKFYFENRSKDNPIIFDCNLSDSNFFELNFMIFLLANSFRMIGSIKLVKEKQILEKKREKNQYLIIFPVVS